MWLEQQSAGAVLCQQISNTLTLAKIAFQSLLHIMLVHLIANHMHLLWQTLHPMMAELQCGDPGL
jgi:hypothetical protein